MYFAEEFDSPISSSSKRVRFYRNGNFDLYYDLKLTSTTRFSDIRKTLDSRLEKGFNHLRLFNNEGVEIMEDDIEFIKDGAKLYASQGEEFDANSSFSEYEILSELGEGGFGKVMLGVHKVTKQKVAIKIIKTHMIGNAQDIDMVFREAEILKQLKHKNIVKILNSFTLSNMQVVFIMEYLEGGELLDLVIKKGHFEEEEAKNFFRQIVSAIAYCHMNKMIHRDLKLENLLLASNDQVKAIDFGIAGMESNFNVDTVDAGSLRYMAPEVLTGHCKTINGLVDVWAMGIILYGMLFGDLPFNGKTNKEIADAIIEGTYEMPKHLAKKLSKNCLDCLAKTLDPDPSTRVTAVELQYHPWLTDEQSHHPHEEHQEQEHIEHFDHKHPVASQQKGSVDRKDKSHPVNQNQKKNLTPRSGVNGSTPKLSQQQQQSKAVIKSGFKK